MTYVPRYKSKFKTKFKTKSKSKYNHKPATATTPKSKAKTKARAKKKLIPSWQPQYDETTKMIPIFDAGALRKKALLQLFRVTSGDNGGNGGAVANSKPLPPPTAPREEAARSNAEFWDLLHDCESAPMYVKDTEQWGLVLLPPRKADLSTAEAATTQLISINHHHAPIGNRVFIIRRSKAQICLFRALHSTFHGALGHRGQMNLKKCWNPGNHTNMPKIKTILPDQNCSLSSKNPFRPMVSNKGKLVDEVSAMMEDMLRKHVVEILQLGERDDSRNLHSFNVGITHVQATSWWSHRGMTMPGLMSKTSKLSPELGGCLFDITCALVKGIESECFSIQKLETLRQRCDSISPTTVATNDTGSRLFLPPTAERQIFWDLFAAGLGRGESNSHNNNSNSNSKYFRVEGIAVIVGPAATDVHLDTYNDAREGYDWVISTSILADFTKSGRTAVTPVSMEAARKAVWCTSCVPMMLILYTRHIVGLRCKQLKTDNERKSVPFQMFRGDCMDDSWKDTELLTDPSFFRNMLKNHQLVKVSIKLRIAKRLAAVSNCFGLSIYADTIIRFVFYLRRAFGYRCTRQQILECVIFVVRAHSSIGGPNILKVFGELCCQPAENKNSMYRWKARLKTKKEETRFYPMLDEDAKRILKCNVATLHTSVSWKWNDDILQQVDSILQQFSKKEVPPDGKEAPARARRNAKELFQSLMREDRFNSHDASNLIHLCTMITLLPAYFHSEAYHQPNDDVNAFLTKYQEKQHMTKRKRSHGQSHEPSSFEVISSHFRGKCRRNVHPSILHHYFTIKSKEAKRPHHHIAIWSHNKFQTFFQVRHSDKGEWGMVLRFLIQGEWHPMSSLIHPPLYHSNKVVTVWDRLPKSKVDKTACFKLCIARMIHPEGFVMYPLDVNSKAPRQTFWQTPKHFANSWQLPFGWDCGKTEVP